MSSPWTTIESEVSPLLRGELPALSSAVRQWNVSRCLLDVTIIIIGVGCYGASMGWWRDPQQAVFTAVKFPLIILLTMIGNALINAMLAPLLGLNIPFRQSFTSILSSFVIASMILGAFSPLLAFLTWNTPPLEQNHADKMYSFLLLGHVMAIAFAGVAGNLRLLQLLSHLAGSKGIGTRVLVSWLAGNLFLGSQLSWILRPFIGSPGLPVEFFRADALKGNFYEAVFHSIQRLF